MYQNFYENLCFLLQMVDSKRKNHLLDHFDETPQLAQILDFSRDNKTKTQKLPNILKDRRK